MAKVTVDEELCIGCGLCAANCPDLFEMGSDNKAYVKKGGPCDNDLNQVASECPVEAIKVE